MAYIPTIHTFEDDVKNTNESNSNIVDSNNVDNDAIFTDNLLSTYDIDFTNGTSIHSFPNFVKTSFFLNESYATSRNCGR